MNGHYQGACFPFRSGFASGSLSLHFSKDGMMFVGGTNRGWGSRGNKPFALERMSWTGQVPFEIHEMHARPDGFEFTFTQPVDPKTLADLASYQVQTYTYLFRSDYGSPEVDHTKPVIKSATPAADGKSVKLVVEGLQIGHVHEFTLAGIKNQQQQPLLHNQAFYTLNRLPKN